MSREQDDRALGTADFLNVGEAPRPLETQASQGQDASASARATGGELAALFDNDVSQDFRARWTEVQGSFVDDPKMAVQHADELVAQVMKSLAESFAKQRASIEADVGGADQASTENLRIALRSYRSFFERLLSL
ncbi:MAG: hypothetical protein V4787_06645 [Pseudomonadota bacterium]